MSGCCEGGKKKNKIFSLGKIDKTVLFIAFITLSILAAGLVWAVKSGTPAAQLSQTQGTSLKLSDTNFDWGDIPINGGNVDKVFEIENTGSSTLELANFITSCMCTTVKVITSAGESPEFGMHDKSDWKGTIAPGESAQIKVVFDPAYHGPQGKGSLTRIIQFNTNASGSRQVELTLTGTVI
jgi:hypothetical protein